MRAGLEILIERSALLAFGVVKAFQDFGNEVSRLRKSTLHLHPRLQSGTGDPARNRLLSVEPFHVPTERRIVGDF